MDPMIIAALISLAPGLFQMLFGGGSGEKQQQQQTSTTTALPGGYQSPTLGLMDLMMQGTLGKNLQTFGGAGLPGGQTVAPDFLKDFMDLIGSEYGNLQKKYQPAPEEQAWVPPTKVKSYGNYAGR